MSARREPARRGFGHRLRPREPLSVPQFAGLLAVLNTLLFQWPLLHYAASHLDLARFEGMASLLLLVLLQGALTAIVLLAAGTVSVRLMKLLGVLMMLANAVALYFMTSYDVLLDKGMIGNLFTTDPREVRGLLHPRLVAFVVGLGVLPAWLAGWLPVRRRRVWHAPAWLLGIAVVLVAAIYASGSSWPWFDRHAKQLGGRLLPWGYVVNLGRYAQDEIERRRPLILLPPAERVDAPPAGTRRVVVLAIGETARAANVAYYGYPRDTTPYTRADGLAVLRQARSCATYTTQSVACLLSHQGSAAPASARDEPLPSYLQRHGVDVIWRTNNFGEPKLRISTYERRDAVERACRPNCLDDGFDGAMLNGLAERIQQSTSNEVFVVLHLYGSHGPQYSTRYPPAFERFTPVCHSVQLRECNAESLVNAYDNTLVYTDHVLHSIVGLLGALPNTESVMLYVSDHGESLGENGVYLHGAPNALAPDLQRDVPFLVWMSPGFQNRRGLSAEALAQRPESSSDVIFHSVMGAFGLRSSIYKPPFDLFAGAP